MTDNPKKERKYEQSLYQRNREKWKKIERGYQKKRLNIPLNDDERDDYKNAGLSHFGFDPFE